MPLDLTSLRNALEALERSLRVAAVAADTMDSDTVETIRGGVIHSFKIAYEQCWKFIQRWLRENAGADDADYPRTRKDLFRTAARSGLISNPQAWFEYGDARNLTSHTYSELQAAAVFEAASRFAADASSLLAKLESMNDRFLTPLTSAKS